MTDKISYAEYIRLKNTDPNNALTYKHQTDIINANKMSYDLFSGKLVDINGVISDGCKHSKYTIQHCADTNATIAYTCSLCNYKWYSKDISYNILNENKDKDDNLTINTNVPLAEELSRINKIKIEKQLENIFKILPQMIQTKMDIWESQSVIIFDDVFTKQSFEIGSKWEEPGKCIKQLQEWAAKQGFLIKSAFSNKCPCASHNNCVDPCAYKKAYGIIFKF